MSGVNLNSPYPALNQPLPEQTGAAAGTSQAPAAGAEVGGLTAAQREQLVAAAGGVGAASAPVPGTQGAAPLPDVAGGTSKASTRDAAAGGAIRWLELKPFNLEAALDTVAQATRDSFQQAGDLRRTASQSELAAQSESFQQTIKEVQGERESARNQLIGAVAGAATSFAAGSLGAAASLLQKGPGLQIGGAGLQASGQAISQIVSKATDLADTTHGGKFDADNAKIAKALADQLAATYKIRNDEFTQAQQQAQQSLQNAFVDTRKEIYANLNSTQQAIASNI